MRRFILPLFLCAAAALAAPNVVASSVAAEASGDVVRQVNVVVLVENKGNEASPPGVVTLVLTPKVSPSQKSKTGDSMTDPFTLSQPIGPLQPNEKKPVDFKTPYQTRNSFKGQRGTFRANNIDPTGGDTVVTFSASVKLEPAAK